MHSRGWGRLAGLAAVTALAMATFTGVASAATVTANSGVDEGGGIANGLCSIREAIDEAQQNAQAYSPDCVFDTTQPYGNDTINLLAGTTYALTGASGENANDTGDLDINMPVAGNGLTIAGAGPTSVIDANDNDRVIHFFGPGTGVLSNLTVTDGTAPAIEGGGGVLVNLGSTVTLSGATVSSNTTASRGGGIFNGGALTISGGSSITGNSTSTSNGIGGAGINSAGTLTIDGSSVTSNTVTAPNDAVSAGVQGGGVMQWNNATLTVTDSTISGNTINSLDPSKAPSGAGIALTEGNLVLQRSTVSGNVSGGGSIALGGGIDFADSGSNNTLTIENSTLSGNAASSVASAGAGINISRGITKIANATFTNNNSVSGRAIFYQRHAEAGSTVTVRGSIFSEDNANECSTPQGPLTSAGYNIDRNTSCGLGLATDQQNTTPTLGSLASNGGPTQTHALGIASAGVGDIPASQCFDTTGSTLLATDQRGVSRPQAADCDIGAYELGPACNGQTSTVVGTGSSETLNGSSGADVIVAGGGADTVNGGDGADVICGGDGNDLIRTGTGGDNDTALGEGDTDTIAFDDLSAGMTSASLATGINSTGGTDVGVDSLSGFENLTGSPFNDVSGSTGLTGNAGQNTIDGGGGNDTIQGLGDNDTLIGGLGTDTATWISLGPVDASLASGTATGGQGTDSLSGFENLTGSPSADTLTGNDDVNTLITKARQQGGAQASQLPAQGITPQQRQQVVEAVKEARFDVYSGKDDKILRKLSISIDFDVPQGRQGPSGVQSGSLVFTLQITDLNQPQTVVAPANTKPFADLVKQIQGLNLPGLGGSGSSSGGSSSGGSSGPTGTPDKRGQEYIACIAKAKGDVQKAQKCADLLKSP